MNYKLYVSAFILSLASLSLSMELSQEKFSLFQDAPLTDWKKTTTIYDNAYQGASYSYSDTEAYERYLKKVSEEERGVIQDWVYAVQQVEKKLLQKPLETWTIDDIKQLSAWLNRSSGKNPGCLRTEATQWLLRNMTTQEAKILEVLAARALISREPKERLVELKKHPNVKKNPTLLVPLTKEEEEYMKKSVHIFPVGDAIEQELVSALIVAQAHCASLKALPWEQRQQRALTLGCTFHYDMVRIHPFTEGAKRLGRLCMFIFHAQNGISPLGIQDALAYTQSLQASLVRSSSEPFEQFIRSCFEQARPLKATSNSTPKKVSTAQSKKTVETVLQEALVKPFEPWTREDTKQVSARLTDHAPVFKCALCSKEGTTFQRCGRCKSAYYCNKDCQTNHWKAGHKVSCKASSDETSAKK